MSLDLAVKDLTMAFGGLRALDGVSVSFPAGCITGLIGPNGSGKSTMINAITGMIKPTSGDVKLGGASIVSLRSDQIVKQGVARTFQIPKVPPQLTVREVISVPFSFVGRKHALIEGLSDAHSIAAYFKLDHVFERRCADLSVTNLRRLEIARAIACGPSVLLLDEAMAGLSHEDAVEVGQVVKQVHEAGVTVVIIEHMMSVISSLCDGVVVLNQGRLLAQGQPREVLSDPAVREAYLGKGFQL